MKKTTNKLTLVIIFITNVLLLASCITTPEPNDETLNKGHGNWYKVDFKFTQGVLKHESNNDMFYCFPETGEHLKTVQVFSFENRNIPGEGIITNTNEPVRLMNGASYGLEIIYYNKKGEVMNWEFTTEKMSPIHQHFFQADTINGVRVEEKSDIANIINYTYRDTEPWDGMIGDEGVTFRDDKDRLGFKGVIEVKQENKQFNLKVILVHVIKGTKLADDGTPYPFYNPSGRLLGTRDLTVKVPITVFTTFNTPDNKDYILDVEKEFKITKDQAKEDINKISILKEENCVKKM